MIMMDFGSNNSDMFLSDPFLSLDNDLDDVSEVIRNNMDVDQKSLFDSSPTPSPQQQYHKQIQHESGMFATNYWPLVDFGINNTSKEREIGQIVSLLQDEADGDTNQHQIHQHIPGLIDNTQQMFQSAMELSSRNNITINNHAEFIEENPQSVVNEFFEDDGQKQMFNYQMHDPHQTEAHQQQLLQMIQSQHPIDQHQANDVHLYPYSNPLELVHQQPYEQDELEAHAHQQQLTSASNDSGFEGQCLILDPDNLRYQQLSLNIPHDQAHSRQIQQLSPPPLEPNFGNIVIKQELLAQNNEDYGDDSQIAPSTTNPTTDSPNSTKKDLIRMLLEMTPNELETLRSSRPRPLQSLQFVQQHHQHPPSDPPPPPTTASYASRKFAIEPYSVNGKVRPPPLKKLSVAVDLSSGEGQYSNGMILPGQCLSSPTGTLVSPTGNLVNTLGQWSLGSNGLATPAEWAEDSDEEGTTSELGNNQQYSNKKGPRTERRTAHNLIEKKYRCSINDRIHQLKDMLASDEAKMSKSATLRKAIDHIFTLRAQNNDLQKANDHMRQMLEAAGIQPPPLSQFEEASNARASYSPKRKSMAEIKSESSVGRPRKTAAMIGGQSRVTLCVFMFMVVLFNPLSIFLTSSDLALSSSESAQGNRVPRSAGTGNMNQPSTYSLHRTFAENFAFDSDADAGEQTAWWQASFFRHTFVWLLNTLVVVVVLMRLLVYGEPVFDGRSQAWMSFLNTKSLATHAISVGNYKEAQRQLCEALQVLGRPLPVTGGVEEFMSLVWQCIRHMLNTIWIGRWFARRRRSPTQPQKVVCRSHAATALIYHQLHQLHLIGVNGIRLGQLGALNLALLAANLAESAGISRSGITHRIRAEIYINAALRIRLAFPRFLGLRRLFSVYFFKRAKRHVRKSTTIEGTDLRSVNWIFHPLAKQFIANPIHLMEMLENSEKQSHNEPFSDARNSPRPIECLKNAFKMHLLGTLMRHLTAPKSSNIKVTDFVEVSHLLLDICTMEQQRVLEGTQQFKDSSMAEWGELDSSIANDGDELCTWWTHLITGGLFWRHDDKVQAKKHYLVVRKCPTKLLKNDLALGIGLAFCSRKMCIDDRAKKNFSEMVWMHVLKSFTHLKHEGYTILWKGSPNTMEIQKFVRGISYEWILMSVLDIWHFNLSQKKPYWEQNAPSQMRRLYHDVLLRLKTLKNESDREKVLIFDVLGRALTGANPVKTWKMLKVLSPSVFDSNRSKTQQQQVQGKKAEKKDLFLEFDCQFEIVQKLRKDFGKKYSR